MHCNRVFLILIIVLDSLGNLLGVLALLLSSLICGRVLSFLDNSVLMSILISIQHPSTTTAIVGVVAVDKVLH
jgi:hypothetical protein